MEPDYYSYKFEILQHLVHYIVFFLIILHLMMELFVFFFTSEIIGFQISVNRQWCTSGFDLVNTERPSQTAN